MSKVLRISANTFEKLEAIVKGFESPSEVIDRAIKGYEEVEVIKIVTRSIISSEEFVKETGKREKIVLLHQLYESIDNAMSHIVEVFPQYIISYKFERPNLTLKIELK